MEMQGNTILVAGGTQGIGRGVAELLCRLGNEVLVFGGEAGAIPGIRTVDLDLSDPWSVAGFCEQVAATCPSLNMLVNITIAFPVRHLPGLNALLDGDDSHDKLQARRLGVQHLTGALLPHFRKRAHSAILNLSAGPRLAAPLSPTRPVLDQGLRASTLSVSKRWANASVELIDVTLPSRVERTSRQPQGIPRNEFISQVAHLLADGPQEAAALARLQALWPAAQPTVRETRDDVLVSEAY